MNDEQPAPRVKCCDFPRCRVTSQTQKLYLIPAADGGQRRVMCATHSYKVTRSNG